MRHATRPLVLLAALLALGACNASPQQPVASAPAATSAASGVTPSSFSMPQGAGCSGDVARWRAIQDNDLQTGHVSKSVYDRIRGEIDAAAAACAAGRDAEASGLVRASRARHGYPAG